MATRTITADVEHIPGMSVRALLSACMRVSEDREMTREQYVAALDWMCIAAHDAIEGVDRGATIMSDADAEALARYPDTGDHE